MAKNITTKTTISNLTEELKKTFARQTALTALQNKVNALETAGGQPNKIEKIQVNGTELTIQDGKIVDITVPTKVSDLTNDSKYQTQSEMATAIQQAIAASGHASFSKVDSVPAAASAKENVLYLVMNSATGHYDIYAKVGNEVVLLDDTTVDLTAYATTEAMNTALSGKVDKVSGKGLSTNDYTSAEKTKLSGVATGATKVEASTTNGKIKINGTETSVYTLPSTVIQDTDISDFTAAEIAAMLAE